MCNLRNSVCASAVLICLASCTLNTPYHHFETVANEGWDREDTIQFSVDSLRSTGTYTLSLEMRSTDMYPYRNLDLMVLETVFPSKANRSFNLHFEMATEKGEHIGTGLTQYDLSKVLARQYLRQGDSIHVKVCHKMRRMLLPGVKDVGLKLACDEKQ